jgi:hypothetical protein
MMYFRVSCVIDDLVNKMCDESITYDLARSFVVHISIERQLPNDTSPQAMRVIGTGTAAVDLEESEGVINLIEAITKAKDGPFANFAGMNDKMKGIWEVVDPVFRTLGTDLKASIAILRWRYGITDSPIKPMSSWVEAVSLDGTNWRSISTLRSLQIVFSGVIKKVDNSALHEVGRLHNAGAEPPLGLLLINEARNQKVTHPRSCLVIAVAAAEIAIKQLIGELAPDARWLAENVPSPPIHKIMRDYLPTLKVKARFTKKSIRPPRQLLRRLEDAVQLRNKVVHAGEAPPDDEKLSKILTAMEDIIWVCILYSGQGWAAQHISYDTMSVWLDESASTPASTTEQTS